MNHLTHPPLARDDPEAKAGRGLADFVAASDTAAFVPGIQAGIRTNPLVSGGEALRNQYAALEADFQGFFPSLAQYARALAAAGRK